MTEEEIDPSIQEQARLQFELERDLASRELFMERNLYSFAQFCTAKNRNPWTEGWEVLINEFLEEERAFAVKLRRLKRGGYGKLNTNSQPQIVG